MQTRVQQDNNLQPLRTALLGLTRQYATDTLGKPLINLVLLRVSQINGCAFCLDMHSRDLLEGGERPERLAVLPAWRETNWFSARERAALAFAETLTVVSTTRDVPDDVFDAAAVVFTEAELADLTLATIAINGWNRVNLAFRVHPAPVADLLAAD